MNYAHRGVIYDVDSTGITYIISYDRNVYIYIYIYIYIYTVQATDQHRDEEKLFYMNDTRRKDSSWGLISSNDVTLGRATPTFRS
jgi:hypothetical protein